MRRLAAVLCGLLALSASSARAQSPQTDAPDDTQPAAAIPFAARYPVLSKITVDRAGGIHFSPTFAVVFGGIKQGSSMAAGPAVSHDFADGSFVQAKGVYSIRNFKLVQLRYDSRPLFSRRGLFSTRVRWQDAPELSIYALGPDSSHARAEYGEQKFEWSGFVRGGIAPHLNVTGQAGVERYSVNAGFIDDHEDERLGIVPDAPGLATRPWFLHTVAAIAYDTRPSPDVGRTGTALAFATHHYHDMHDGGASFRGFEVGAGHIFPTIETSGTGGARDWRGALELSGRAWLTHTGEGSVVPFNLMPTLGGGDVLIGYSSYRFRDRNAVLLRGEYRWAVHPMIDVAGIYEAGTVAPSIGAFALDDMAQSIGAGIRVHSKSSGLMRLFLARDREGLQFVIGFNIGA